MACKTLCRVLDQITPARVRKIVLALDSRQASRFGSLVTLTSLAEALIGDADLGQGQARGQAYEQVRLAIRDAVEQNQSGAGGLPLTRVDWYS
jgi:hypothetical protein